MSAWASRRSGDNPSIPILRRRAADATALSPEGYRFHIPGLSPSCESIGRRSPPPACRLGKGFAGGCENIRAPGITFVITEK
jgi:hypothetical protein